MHAFMLETLLSKGWRKGGEVFWTLKNSRACTLILWLSRNWTITHAACTNDGELSHL